MPGLKSLLMLLAVTVVGAGFTIFIQKEIASSNQVTVDVSLVTPDSFTDIFSTTSEASLPVENDTEINSPPTEVPKTSPVIPPATTAKLTGTLTSVNVGCFADGECSATVAGTKVILLIGWYQGKVGQIVGADGIGDLENYIGQEVTVYAGVDNGGAFSLLGNESYYLKVASSTVPTTSGSCVVGGCSAQLCGEADAMDGMVTTCEYKEEYACFKKTKCERQATGQCDWTETPELTMCLSISR